MNDVHFALLFFQCKCLMLRAGKDWVYRLSQNIQLFQAIDVVQDQVFISHSYRDQNDLSCLFQIIWDNIFSSTLNL